MATQATARVVAKIAATASNAPSAHPAKSVVNARNVATVVANATTAVSAATALLVPSVQKPPRPWKVKAAPLSAKKTPMPIAKAIET